MLTDATFEELEQLLTDERDAIRRLDGTRVLEFAQRKQQLIAQLCQAGPALPAPAAKRLQAVMPMLRQNGVLLAHARNVLRDAVAVMRRASGPTALPLAPSPVGSTISVRG